MSGGLSTFSLAIAPAISPAPARPVIIAISTSDDPSPSIPTRALKPLDSVVHSMLFMQWFTLSNMHFPILKSVDLGVEATMEIGQFAVDFAYPENDNQRLSNEDSDADEEGDLDPSTTPPLFSKYFTTIAQTQRVLRRRHDTRTRLQRNQQEYEAWQAQMPALVDYYLERKHGPSEDQHDDGAAPEHFFHVDLISVFSYTPRVSVHQRHEEQANVSLMRAGAVGCSPTQPTVAVALQCLELYHRLRRRQSSFSIQAMVKTLCALHNITYTHHLRVQFSVAFDVYLDILRRIRCALDQALGRVGLQWKLRGACPCCAFSQPDEPVLIPARLHSMDGNQSAKRLDGSGYTDPRAFASDYFVPVDQVERFKDDVKSKARSDSKQAACTDNWNAANPGGDEQIKVFEQTGIFLLACRHGFMECVIEMKRSGELAKYSLSAVNQILEFCGQDQAIGHDIGCVSKGTVASSSLGQKAKESNLSIVVNAFHGFAHNRACQLENHPLYLQGFGNEDLETCERIFASSNSTASVIRHASYCHWKQFLDLHFDQWDCDKYLELSKFLLNNYCQALNIIDKYSAELATFKSTTGFTDADFEKWHEEEKKYMCNCANESREVSLAVEYVELLQKLQFAEATYGSQTTAPFLTYTPAQYTPTSGLNTTARMCTSAITAEYASALRRYRLQMNAVEHFEKHRTFIRVVDELEGLVVQRLFELSKANLASTGYKMRKHISKALAKRSTAIRTTLERYNKLAPRQTPPRRTLDYTEVISYATLGDFALLKSSHTDILSKPWATLTNRDMLTKYFKVLRSQEEIERLNVEIRRLAAWVDFDDRKIHLSAEQLRQDGFPYLAVEMDLLYAEHHRVNDVHRVRLRKMYLLMGFSGSRPPPAISDDGGDVADEIEEEEDVVNGDALRLSDCLDRIS
ncbi:hypothetical protein JVT61DRAFT_10136 [Boletus reticuloceps]|uniref:CxC1-like cysteine cluster associated with KDZ transposases domain-containing protein n=1 Tax=Boletus reticuloceps TaxID=495285 RepID=A0A8I3ADN7_9AGAM|nr:hypothetical protein JVT61DRAFT_10136 [Boletus reticuloceps]